MADPISILGALASASTVKDLSCNAIRQCLEAIKKWKARYAYWEDVTQKFKEYLSYLDRSAKVVEKARELKDIAIVDADVDWECIVNKCRQFCEKLKRFHQSWTDRQEESRRNALTLYYYFALRSQSEKVIIELDNAKLQLLLYQQLLTSQLQVQGMTDIGFIRMNLATLRSSDDRAADVGRNSAQSGQQAESNSQTQFKSSPLRRLKPRTKKMGTKMLKQTKINPVQATQSGQDATTLPTQPNIQQEESHKAEAIMDETSSAWPSFDTRSVLTASTTQTGRSMITLDESPFVLQVEVRISISCSPGDVLLCMIDGTKRSGYVEQHVSSGSRYSLEELLPDSLPTNTTNNIDFDIQEHKPIESATENHAENAPEQNHEDKGDQASITYELPVQDNESAPAKVLPSELSEFGFHEKSEIFTMNFNERWDLLFFQNLSGRIQCAMVPLDSGSCEVETILLESIADAAEGSPMMAERHQGDFWTDEWRSSYIHVIFAISVNGARILTDYWILEDGKWPRNWTKGELEFLRIEVTPTSPINRFPYMSSGKEFIDDATFSVERRPERSPTEMVYMERHGMNWLVVPGPQGFLFTCWKLALAKDGFRQRTTSGVFLVTPMSLA
ncbi:hypothetical protein EG329_002255 [Mollisiaceae sp. DMI_Dod_QoI]|nr:hypothetical protein EG329_002255 [Helotiales sp. DMI_Dod_QoI]